MRTDWRQSKPILPNFFAEQKILRSYTCYGLLDHILEIHSRWIATSPAFSP